jgi:hypothetical protein
MRMSQAVGFETSQNNAPEPFLRSPVSLNTIDNATLWTADPKYLLYFLPNPLDIRWRS